MRTLRTQTSLGSWAVLWSGHFRGCELEDLETCLGTNRTCTVPVAAQTEGLGMCQVGSARPGHANDVLMPTSTDSQTVVAFPEGEEQDSEQQQDAGGRRETARCSLSF